MKLLFISDIHGIKTNLSKIKYIFSKLRCDKLIILGDILNNSSYIKDYDRDYVLNFLKIYKDKIIIIKGNCDHNVDFKELDITPTYLKIIKTKTKDIYITHGHLYNDNNWNKEKTILIQGHTHIPSIKKQNNNLYINPGSISKPRGNYKASYLYFDEKEFTIYDISDNIIARKRL